MRGEWTYETDLLTGGECNWLIETYGDTKASAGTIGMAGEDVDTSIRDAKVQFLPRGPRGGGLFESIYRRIDRWVALANDTWFGVDYHRDGRPDFQFSIYREGHYYRPHQDSLLVSGEMPTQRKVSVTVQLSDGDSYEGGDFRMHFVAAQPPPDVLRRAGTAIAFPSLAIHEVEPVTKGVRYALVGWYPGPRWR